MQVFLGFFLFFFAGFIVVYACEVFFNAVANLGNFLDR